MKTFDLPNGCSRGKISIHPQNWQRAGATLKKDWYLFFRFYDPSSEKQMKLVIMKGMNQFHSLVERREYSKKIIAEVHYLLEEREYNPITNFIKQDFAEDLEEKPVYEVEESTYFIPALRKAQERLKCSETTKKEVKKSLRQIEIAIRQLGYSKLKIGEVRTRDVIYILDKVGINKNKNGWTASSFNHYRAYTLMLFKELRKLEVTEINPSSQIERMDETPKIREILSKDQISLIHEHLFKRNYNLWRFWCIFSESGCRLTEMVAIKKDKVNIDRQGFYVLIKKGKKFEWKFKTITKSTLHLWVEVMNDADPDGYLFSKFLKPGRVKIKAANITRRWFEYVKEPLNISADIYSMRHKFATEVMDRILKERKEAAVIAGAMLSHTGSDMVLKKYDVKREERDHDQLKEIVFSNN